MKRLRGFTLIELMVVIAVIGILTTVAIIGLNRYQANTRDAQRVASATSVAEALEKYYDQNGEYPGCTQITQAASTVTASGGVLQGVKSSGLAAPQSSGTTNSITCTDLTAVTGSDIYAYVGDGSATCTSGTSCLQFTLKYKNETTGTIDTITSRHKTALATSGSPVLSGTVGGPYQVNVSWTAVPNAVSYTVERATNAVFSAGLVATQNITTTSTTVGSLTAGTMYYFRVTPVSGISESGGTSNVIAKRTAPSAPTGVTATSDSASQITVNWTASAAGDVGGYVVQYATNSSFTPYSSASSTLATSKAITGLTANTQYYFRVEPRDPDGVAGEVSTSTSQWTKPATPTGLAVSQVDSTTLTADWDSDPASTSYTIEYSEDSGFASGVTTVTDLTTNSYTATSLRQGQRVYFRVTTVVSGRSSDASAAAYNNTTIDQPDSAVWIGSKSWTHGTSHTVNYTSYCPSGTSLVKGPSFSGGFRSTGFNWSDGSYYYHGWGYSDSWTFASGYGSGDKIRYQTNYRCTTSYATSPNAATTTTDVAIT